MNKIIKLLAISIIVVLSACKFTDHHIAQAQAKARLIERQDHKTCQAEGINLEKWSDVSTEGYWRCRHNLIQTKIIHNPNNVFDIEHNKLMAEIRQQIKVNLERSKQAVLLSSETNLDAYDHGRCLQVGHTLDTADQRKNEEYYACRQKLINDRSPKAPGITGVHRSGSRYVASIAQEKVLEGEINYALDKINKYPNCKNVNSKSIFFENCLQAQKESETCLNNIRTLKAKKHLNNRIYCQRQAFVQFPDDYTVTRNKSMKQIEEMLRIEREEKIAKLKEQKEKDINRTKKFFEDGYVSKNKIITSQDDRQNVKKSLSEREKLFNRIQVLQLREEFIKKCNQSLELQLPYYSETETQKCIAIGTEWNQEEEDL